MAFEKNYEAHIRTVSTTKREIVPRPKVPEPKVLDKSFAIDYDRRLVIIYDRRDFKDIKKRLEDFWKEDFWNIDKTEEARIISENPVHIVQQFESFDEIKSLFDPDLQIKISRFIKAAIALRGFSLTKLDLRLLKFIIDRSKLDITSNKYITTTLQKQLLREFIKTYNECELRTAETSIQRLSDWGIVVNTPRVGVDVPVKFFDDLGISPNDLAYFV